FDETASQTVRRQKGAQGLRCGQNAVATAPALTGATCTKGARVAAGSPGAGPTSALSPPARLAAGTLGIDDQCLSRLRRDIYHCCAPVLCRTMYRRALYCWLSCRGGGDSYSSP